MGGAKVLLIKQKGEFFAIAPKCTHYGAPLVKGCLGQGRIRCPWHGACFNIKTGDIEDFPGLDSLQTYKVRRMKRWCTLQCLICMYSLQVVVEGENVVVKADKKVFFFTSE